MMEQAMSQFVDCLGREIKIGDVLVNKRRFGVVQSFTEKAILADVVRPWESYDCATDCYVQRGRFRKGRFVVGADCFITRFTEAQLRNMITLVAE